MNTINISEPNYGPINVELAGDGIKILLVDDLRDNLIALEGLLRREDGQIFMAKSGREALELMISHEFAVALIDVQMPNMSGFELAELMRGTKRTKSIPIIFVTATAKDQRFSFKGYESGAVDFLLKPLDTYAVKSKVNVFIEFYRQKNELRSQLNLNIRNQLEQEKLLAQLSESQAGLRQAVQVREEFMSMASHELKTPLTSLRLQSQIRMRNLKKGDLSHFSMDRLTKMFKGDEKHFERITHLIDDMLDISRIELGRLPINKETFDLGELVRKIVQLSSDQLIEAGCELKVDLCPGVLGSWDRFRMEQVIVNLLSNAMRYGPSSPISIVMTASQNGVQIRIGDKGRGIAKENHDRIFNRFERAVSGNDVSGLGLGLYIVKQILEAHGGSIGVQSELGMGATFIVNLPMADTAKENLAGPR